MSEFIYYSLLAFTKDIQKLGSGTTFKEVSGSVMKQICIPLPPLSEQQRIVDKLDEILPELEKLSQDEIKLEELQKSFPQQLKSSLLQAAIQGKLTDQLPEDGNVLDLLEEIKAEKQHLISAGKLKKEKPLPPITEDEIPFEIPDNWFWVRYSDVFSIGSSRRVHERDWRSKGVPYYRAREIAVLAEKGYIDNELFIDIEFYEKLKSESGVPKSGDLMVTGVGTLGKTYVVKEADKFYYKDACVLCVSNFGSIFSNYIKLFIEAPFMKDQINSNSSGTTVSTLTISRFNKYLLALPPYEEQKRIVDRLQVLLPLCDALD